tara:strand:+ start:120 stop:347 length:228 start_codon:yes stop_codon:yes gene_type:complete
MIELFFKRLLNGSSLAFTLVFSIGHIMIAASVVYFVTGATLWESGAVALIEPSINGVWLYILHRIWKTTTGKDQL